MQNPIPVRIRKRSEITAPLRAPGAAARPQSACSGPVEPKVQLVERSPGVYDILFTCRCGEQTLIRCESLQ